MADDPSSSYAVRCISGPQVILINILAGVILGYVAVALASSFPDSYYTFSVIASILGLLVFLGTVGWWAYPYIFKYGQNCMYLGKHYTRGEKKEFLSEMLKRRNRESAAKKRAVAAAK